MPKVVYNSHGWVVMSYERSDADRNFIVRVKRESSAGGVTGIVEKTIRLYGEKPPVLGESISLHME